MKLQLSPSQVCWDDCREKAAHTQTDSLPPSELNPLAAGIQTSFTKGEPAYCLDDMNRIPILKHIHKLNT
jgi:hypothetical protein